MLQILGDHRRLLGLLLCPLLEMCSIQQLRQRGPTDLQLGIAGPAKEILVLHVAQVLSEGVYICWRSSREVAELGNELIMAGIVRHVCGAPGVTRDTEPALLQSFKESCAAVKMKGII